MPRCSSRPVAGARRNGRLDSPVAVSTEVPIASDWARRARVSRRTMRICAGGLLVRRDEILLARRSENRKFYPGVWDIIGGHCERDERPVDTLIRELREEIGVEARAFEELAVLDEPRLAEHGE